VKKIICIGLLAGFLLRLSALAAADSQPVPLSLARAQETALRQHPRIRVADLLALAARQNIIEARAPFFPSLFANVTAVGVGDTNNTRLTAGAINNPIIYQREAEGLTVTQLITDFGRTWELTQTSKLNSRAQEMNRIATRADILLALNTAYFAALQSQSLLAVARQTVASRQLVFQQTQALATNQLKSALDVSFASVDLDQARVFQAKAENDLNAGFASLTALLGEREPQTYELSDEPMPAAATNNPSALIFEALANRPELAQARYQRDAAQEFAKAEKKLSYPTISAMAAVGVTPVGDPRLTSGYAAAGINLSLPLFVGGLYRARWREAQDRASVAGENLRDQENTIARDVQISKLNLDYSYQHMQLAQSLLANASEALTLAQARFKLGSTSIIELSQAELNQTSAQIEATNARYDYQTQHSALEFQLGRLR
jgi:outer membrane protein